jgi:hypothetical protein
MFNRRQFLQATGLGSLSFLLEKANAGGLAQKNNPIVISTWAPNVKANAGCLGNTAKRRPRPGCCGKGRAGSRG